MKSLIITINLNKGVSIYTDLNMYQNWKPNLSNRVYSEVSKNADAFYWRFSIQEIIQTPIKIYVEHFSKF